MTWSSTAVLSMWSGVNLSTNCPTFEATTSEALEILIRIIKQKKEFSLCQDNADGETWTPIALGHMYLKHARLPIPPHPPTNISKGHDDDKASFVYSLLRPIHIALSTLIAGHLDDA